MILTTSSYFSTKDITKLREYFDTYIKTVIDLKKKTCVAGMDRHFEGEKILLDSGSQQTNIWGGGIDLETKTIDFNSFINIRPIDNNTSNEIQDQILRQKYEELTKLFFKNIL